jgi:hypothetical protein
MGEDRSSPYDSSQPPQRSITASVAAASLPPITRTAPSDGSIVGKSGCPFSAYIDTSVGSPGGEGMSTISSARKSRRWRTMQLLPHGS